MYAQDNNTLPVWNILSPAYHHISINSHPFLVGIVSNNENLGSIFEFAAPGTPQQNSVAERRIPTFMGRARAMLIQPGIDAKGKGEFWCEVISTATKLDNIMVRPERAKPPHTLCMERMQNI